MRCLRAAAGIVLRFTSRRRRPASKTKATKTGRAQQTMEKPRRTIRKKMKIPKLRRKVQVEGPAKARKVGGGIDRSKAPVIRLTTSLKTKPQREKWDKERLYRA